MMPVRRLMAKLVAPESSPAAAAGRDRSLQAAPAPSCAGRVLRGQAQGVAPVQRQDPTPGEVDALLMSDPVNTNDIETALQTTRPSSDGKAAR